jgi:hypothetical protein
MAEQSFANHAHRPTHTAIVWLFALVALILMVQQMRGSDTRDLAIIAVIFAVFELGWISRVYTVKLQDRIIMLEVKVRAAELLPAGADAQLAKLNSKQIAALRFAVGRGVWRAARARGTREPAAERHQGVDQDLAARPLSHLTKAPRDPGRAAGSQTLDRRARAHAAGVPRLRRDHA